MLTWCGGWNFLARGHPFIPGLHAQPQPIIIHTQVAIGAADHGLGHYGLDFLRHHANIRFVAAIVAETIETEAVIEAAEHDDVVLEPDIGVTAAAVSATTVMAAATVSSAATVMPAAAVVPTTTEMLTAAAEVMAAATVVTTANVRSGGVMALAPMMFAAVMFAAVILAPVMAAMGVTAVMMPAVPAFVTAKAKAVAEFVADDVPARAIPAVVVPAVGLALEAVFFVPAFDVPAFDRRHAAFAGLHYRPHCAKPAWCDGPAFYLAAFHVQILIRLPPVSYADVRSIRILYRLNSPHCAKPARGDGSAFYLAVFHVQILIRLPPVSYADVRSIRILYRLKVHIALNQPGAMGPLSI